MKRSNRSMYNALMHSFIICYLLLQLSCRRNSPKVTKPNNGSFAGNGQRLFSVFLIRSSSRIQDSRVHDLCISRAYAHRAKSCPEKSTPFLPSTSSIIGSLSTRQCFCASLCYRTVYSIARGGSRSFSRL